MIFDHYTKQTGPIRYTDFAAMAFERLNDYQKKVLVSSIRAHKPDLIDLSYLRGLLGDKFDQHES